MTVITERRNRWHQNRWRITAWLGAALLLLIPLIAMQFTESVVWKIGDFAVFGILLGGAGVAFELAVRTTGNIAYRIAAGIALGTAFLLIWIQLAVGII